MTLLEQLERNTALGPAYEDHQPNLLHAGELPVRLIAFYLPQFHRVEENDSWWGQGFTEWTNVTKALPRFVGHYQPQLPGALGFYDLSSVDVLREQVALARQYGVGGFCFHHYWFNGRALLRTPLDNLLNNRDIEMPFFLNWANESWSRRWDGRENEILIEQRHSPEDDVAFASSLEKIFEDPRYIRINGRPLLAVYRPGVMPNAAATVERWRKHFRDRGHADPYIVMPQAFGDIDPRKFGIDAALGFPPHELVVPGYTEQMAGELELLDPEFSGEVYSYDRVASLGASLQPEGFRYFPGVCTAWDNQARRPKKGICFLGSTPKRYGQWLSQACAQAIKAASKDERIVFINAWNEWAEGAHLEPDRHFGYAYLAETARVIGRFMAQESNQASEAPQPAPRRERPGGTKVLAQKALYRVADLLEDFAARIRP